MCPTGLFPSFLDHEAEDSSITRQVTELITCGDSLIFRPKCISFHVGPVSRARVHRASARRDRAAFHTQCACALLYGARPASGGGLSGRTRTPAPLLHPGDLPPRSPLLRVTSVQRSFLPNGNPPRPGPVLIFTTPVPSTQWVLTKSFVAFSLKKKIFI